jgi:hypothetical protein
VDLRDWNFESQRDRKSTSSVWPQNWEWNLYIKLMEALGIDPKRKPMQGSTIARIVEEHETFAPKYKIHSTIVHPTAFSILATTQAEMYAALLPMISNEARSNVVMIFTSIRDHVAAHDIGWPKDTVV